MFTGIVSETGTVVSAVDTDGGRRLTIEASAANTGLVVGDSIAVAGVCLTAVAVTLSGFEVQAVSETLARTTVGSLSVGDPVNLERPVGAAGRLDGHLVQGHVDGVATVRSVESEGDSRRVWIDPEPDLLRYIVAKGSVALDGVSLTVSGVDDSGFEVALIPHTLAVTTWGSRAAGDRINIEVDVLAKYVERLLEARS